MNAKYDWSEIPTWVNFLFWHEDEGVIGSNVKPVLKNDTWMGSGRWGIFPDCKHPECDWQDSLEERPK